MSGNLPQNILAHGSRNAGHPEYILHFLHQVIPAGNIPAQMYMNAFKTRATLTPDDFGRIGNQRRGGKLRHRRSYHLPCQQLPRETNQQGNKNRTGMLKTLDKNIPYLRPPVSIPVKTGLPELKTCPSPLVFLTLHAGSSTPPVHTLKRTGRKELLPPSSSIRQTATVLSASVPSRRQCPWNPAHGSARREWARRKTPPPCSCSSRRLYPIHPSRY